MADSNAAAATSELHLDEVTGERVSKTELKKRQKLRQKEADKAAKLASRPAPVAAAGPKKSNAENEEKHLNPNVCSFRFTDT
jgi:lysyl-tRNA synthetase class 2